MELDVAEQFKGRVVSAPAAIGGIKPGRRVFIGSFCGEPQHLVSALLARAEASCDMEVVRFLNLEGSLMGLTADETRGTGYHVRSIYEGSGMITGLTAARRFLTPINLYRVPQLFLKGHIPIEYALIQVSPPDSFGWMNLGVSVDITLAAAQAAGVVIAQVNPRMPKVPGYGTIHVNDVDLFVEYEEELLTTYPVPEIVGSATIARLLANLIENGSTIQASTALTPGLLRQALGDKNDLGVHSQFMTDGLASLARDGVITNRRKGFNEGKMIAGGAVGSAELFKFLDGNPAVEFRPSDYVSNPSVIARHERMVSLNLATTMDLRGQVAADAMPQHHFSDVTGMVDFQRGASMAPGGRSIIIIPAAGPAGGTGNIVPEIAAGAVTLPASDVTHVVSEFGTVNLFGKNIQERAMAMISIAHPSQRERLFEKAREMGLIGRERTISDSIYGVYPAWLEETMVLAGQPVMFRPAKPVDERLIQEHFYEMDQKDVAQRFFGERKHFHWDEVRRVFLVDYARNFSVVAFTGEVGFGHIVGIGSYYREEGKDIAEVAYSVSKNWQGRGVAAALQRKLVEAARENRLAGLYAITNANNQAMIRLFKKLPYKVETLYDEGCVHMRCRFDQPT